MKVVITVAAQEFQGDIRRIFKEAGIEIYSQTDVSGHKDVDGDGLEGNWFAFSSDEQRSIVFFAFTEADKADLVVESVRMFNDTMTTESRIRAFVMAVEKHD